MSLLTRHPRPVLASAAAVAVCAAAALPLLTTPNAGAATPCGNTVTALNKVSSDGFANGGKLKRFNATVDFPNRTGFYDQTGRLMLGSYPAGSVPALLNMPVGDRNTIRSQVTSQRPNAIAAINGDFFIYRTIRGQAVEFARGPMIKDGKIIRSDKQQLKVVGVDSTGKPFGGTVGVHGSIRSNGSRTSIAGVNWHSVQGGGVTLYNSAYSRSAGSPRPAGVAEWVLNRHNKIAEIRTATQNAARRGLAVQSGTRVLAFPSALVSVAQAGAIGQRVRVRTSQVTNKAGVTLRTAIGRGAILVKGGTAAPAGCAAYDHSAAARPRTIVGWTKSGEWRSITVPGNNISGTSRTGGFGLANTAALAKKLGMRFAAELDGGASTTWYTRSGAGTWTRRDLFGVSGGTYERPVANGLAFLPPPTP